MKEMSNVNELSSKRFSSGNFVTPVNEILKRLHTTDYRVPRDEKNTNK